MKRRYRANLRRGLGAGLIGRGIVSVTERLSKGSCVPLRPEARRQKEQQVVQGRLPSAFCLLPSLRTGLILLVEFRVSTGERYIASVDEYVLDLCPYLKRVTIGD